MANYGWGRWEDKWIFGVGSKKIGHPSLMENQLPKKVSKIMGKSNGEWKLKAIEGWLFEEECKAIKEILICKYVGEEIEGFGLLQKLKNTLLSLVTIRQKKDNLMV